MSELLLHWLNEELQFPENVISLQDEFRNGFLLGHVLHIHNQQPDFSRFVDDSTATAMVQNYSLLEPSLRALHVPFDARTAMDMMQGKHDATASILYQIKMKLDRLRRFTTPVSMKSEHSPEDGGGVLYALPAAPPRLPKPKFDAASHSIFVSSIKKLVHDQREVDMAKKTIAFQIEGERQKQDVYENQLLATKQMELCKEAIRVQNQQAQAQRMAYCNDIENHNVQVWLENRRKKALRESAKRRFMASREVRKKQWQMTHKAADRTLVQDDINDFEGRLDEAISTAQAFAAISGGGLDALGSTATGTKGGGKASGNQESDLFLTDVQRSPGPEMTLPALSPAREDRDKKVAGERERRRRRFLSMQEKAQMEEYHKSANEKLCAELTRSCIVEHAIEERRQVLMRYRDVMKQNRIYRNQQYEAQSEADMERKLACDKVAQELDRVVYELHLQSQREKYTASCEARAAIAAARSERQCRQVLEQIVDVAVEVASFRAYLGCCHPPASAITTAGLLTDEAKGADCSAVLVDAEVDDPMPLPQWVDVKRSFVRGRALAGAVPDNNAVAAVGEKRKRVRVSDGGADMDEYNNEGRAKETDGPDAEAVGEEETKVLATYLDDCDLQDYLAGAGCWQIPRPVGAEPTKELPSSSSSSLLPALPESELVADETSLSVVSRVKPEYVLGEVVVEARLAAVPLAAPIPPPDVPKYGVRICLCGRSFTGKSEQALRLAARYRLKALSTGALLEAAVQAGDQAMSKGARQLSVVERLGMAAKSAMVEGLTVPDNIYVALLVEAITAMPHDKSGITAANASAAAAGFVGGSVVGDANGGGGGEGGNGTLQAANHVDNDAGEALDDYAGWIVDDFPETAAQAAALEEALSGYKEGTDHPSRTDRRSPLAPLLSPCVPDSESTGLGDSSSASSCLVGAGMRGIGIVDLPRSKPGAVDMAVFVTAPNEALLRRCAGRRVDPLTSEVYHFEGALPPYDVPCKARLLLPEDPSNPTAHQAFQLATHDALVSDLKVLLTGYGVLKEFDATGLSSDLLFVSLSKLVDEVVVKAAEARRKRKEKEEEEACEREAAQAAMAAALLLDSENVDEEHEEGQAAEVTLNRTTSSEGGKGPGGTVTGKSGAQRKGAGGGDDASTAKKDGDAAATGSGASLKPGMSTKSLVHSATSSSMLAPIPPAFETPVLSGVLAACLADGWQVAESQFIKIFVNVARQLRAQRSALVQQMYERQAQFGAFLSRPHGLQRPLDLLIACFNAMPQDMRFVDTTKKELNLRREECRSIMWAEVEARHAASSAVLVELKEDQWAETHAAMVDNHFLALMQAELDRFHAGVRLILDYDAAVRQDSSTELALLSCLLDTPEDIAGAGGAAGGGGGAGKEKKGAKDAQSAAPVAEKLPVPPEVVPQLCVADGRLASAMLGSSKSVEKLDDANANALKATAAAAKKKRQATVKKGVDGAAGDAWGAGGGDPEEGRPSVSVLESARGQILALADGMVSRAVAACRVLALSLGAGLVRDATEPPLKTTAKDSKDGSKESKDAAAALQADGASTARGSVGVGAGTAHLEAALQYHVAALKLQLDKLVLLAQTAGKAVVSHANALHAELDRRLAHRVSLEYAAVERCMTLVLEAVTTNQPLHFDLRIEGVEVVLDTSRRLVPPTPPLPVPAQHLGGEIGLDAGFSAKQLQRLETALRAVCSTGGRRGDGEVWLLTEQAIDALCRLAAVECAMPPSWFAMEEADLQTWSQGLIDPADVGVVELQHVMRVVSECGKDGPAHAGT